ncbi:hypothetical protein SLS58_006788 [Diplodia intermedia]|uniref:Phosphoribosyltransferase domain-containing protein n=1 Tax=Diplodia intermedia TaxID=856260 RepID=A0ABR3TM38_9PEZI
MSHHADNISGTNPISSWDQPLIVVQGPSASGKPKVIGIYGLPASGKTFMLNKIKQELGEGDFLFFEGSGMIGCLVQGGLEAFHELPNPRKKEYRQLAIDTIGKACTASDRTGIVTGHLMFWPEEEKEGNMVCTPNDLAVYTHILYLDVPVEVIEQRHQADATRTRPAATTAHLAKWKQTEKDQLRRLCRSHGILFACLNPSLSNKVPALIRDFRGHTEQYNLSRAENRLDEIMALQKDQLETILVIDADRTLAAEDTGELYWSNAVSESGPFNGENYPLKSLFSSPMGYSYDAFRQATLLHEEGCDDETFEARCQQVASKVTIYPEMVSLLKLAAEHEHVGVVVVSCGLRRVWELVLEREGLSGTVKLIAGGRIADGFVVTAAVKAAMVARLQDFHRKYVWAFGDSPLDLEMMKKANQAVVVVGDENTRSKSMENALCVAIHQGDLRARQILLPCSVSPRLDAKTMPVAQFTEADLIGSILRRRRGFPIFLATDKNAAKLLATPMRDSAVAGPALRKAHGRAGAYLATEYLTSVIGVEECQISHVQGHSTTGFQLLHEPKTTIVAAMRAGEPMASGVNKMFPRAMFVHASGPESITSKYLQGQVQVLLVDSVINSGATILDFVEAIRKITPGIRIVVVAGTVQAQCISPNNPFYKKLAQYGDISLVALRSSETKFTGSGGTDTGNRLFNTTHLL